MDFIAILGGGMFADSTSFKFNGTTNLPEVQLMSRWTYSISISLLGLMAIGVTVGPSYAAVQYRWLRTVLFGAFGGIGVVPAIHHVAR